MEALPKNPNIHDESQALFEIIFSLMNQSKWCSRERTTAGRRNELCIIYTLGEFPFLRTREFISTCLFHNRRKRTAGNEDYLTGARFNRSELVLPYNADSSYNRDAAHGSTCSHVNRHSQFPSTVPGKFIRPSLPNPRTS